MTNFHKFEDFLTPGGHLNTAAYYKALGEMWHAIEETDPPFGSPVRLAVEKMVGEADLYWRKNPAGVTNGVAQIDIAEAMSDMLYMELRNASHLADSRTLQKLRAFANICREVQSLSYDNKRKVGAIVFRRDFSAITSIGYNGNYAGGPNKRDSQERGGSGYIHAEVNAIMKAGITPDNADKFVLMGTLSPCANCAKIIANSGIKRVLFLEIYEADTSYVEIFSNAGVNYHLLPDEVDPSLSTSLRYMLEK